MNNGQKLLLAVITTPFILIGLLFACVIYDDTVPRETINVKIIDKWMDVKQGYYKIPMCELEDHRIFRMYEFDFMRSELNKTYEIVVFKDRIEIINERWRL
jgi:hypothetical protein